MESSASNVPKKSSLSRSVSERIVSSARRAIGSLRRPPPKVPCIASNTNTISGGYGFREVPLGGSTGLGDVDLFAPLKSLRQTSRYAYTSPAPESLFNKLNDLRRNSCVSSPAFAYDSPGVPETITNLDLNPSSTSSHNFSSSSSSASVTSFPSSFTFQSGAHPLHEPPTTPHLQQIFDLLETVFQFQPSSAKNQLEALECMINSRSGRFQDPITSLWEDYIVGQNSNFRKWYFGIWNQKLPYFLLRFRDKNGRTASQEYIPSEEPTKGDVEDSEVDLDLVWDATLCSVPQEHRAMQVALWLLIWGEARYVFGFFLCK